VSPSNGSGEGSNGAKAIITTLQPAPIWAKKTTTSLAPKNSMWVSGVLIRVNDYPAGTFLHAPAGSWHVPQSTQGACCSSLP